MLTYDEKVLWKYFVINFALIFGSLWNKSFKNVFNFKSSTYKESSEIKHFPNFELIFSTEFLQLLYGSHELTKILVFP